MAVNFGDIDPTFLKGRYSGGTNFGQGLAQFIANTINVVYIIAGLAFFAYFAMGGFKYLTASGDVKQTQEATKAITHALTGLVIVVGSYGLVSILGNILGVNIFSPRIITP